MNFRRTEICAGGQTSRSNLHKVLNLLERQRKRIAEEIICLSQELQCGKPMLPES